MVKTTTWAEIREAIHESGVMKQDIAAVMGYSPSEFARLINSRDTLPRPEWVARFRTALAAELRKVAAK